MPMRRAVLMTRQAISPRLAIRIRLNMLSCLQPLGGILTRNLACGHRGNNSVVQQNQTEATAQEGICGLISRIGTRSTPIWGVPALSDKERFRHHAIQSR